VNFATFFCRQDEERHQQEQDALPFRMRLEKMAIRFKSLHLGNDGTLCLNLSGTQVTDLAPLTQLPVTHLCLQGCYGITDFSPLGNMRLFWLNLCRTRVTDLSVLASLPLLHLDLRGTRTTDLLPLANVPLRSLDIRFTGIGDVSPLGRMPLAELSFHPSRIPKGFALLQDIRTLTTINRTPADEFWRKHSTDLSTRRRSAS
jgi:hypothetical protein